jgi:LuxR family maltose regulon positive regulatory protein
MDEERRWYRYHHLFADLLRQRLRGLQTGLVEELHRRASIWYGENGLPREAVQHALSARDFARATELIDRAAEALWVRGEDASLGRWLDQLPADLRCSRLNLCIYYAWTLLAAGERGAAEEALASSVEALDALENSTDCGAPDVGSELSGLDLEQLRGRIAATRALAAFYSGDSNGIAENARLALARLPAQDLAWRSAATNFLGDAHDFQGDMGAAYRARLDALEMTQAVGNSYQVMIANLKLAIVLRHQARLSQVLEICRQQSQLAAESGLAQSVVGGWLLAIWGEALAERYDLEGARQRATEGVRLAKRGGELAMLASSTLCLIRVLFTRGDLEGAQISVDQMAQTAQVHDVPPWAVSQMAAWQARIWLAQGELDAVSRWRAERGLDVEGYSDYGRESEYIVLARLLIAQERLGDADRLLSSLLAAAEKGERVSRAVEVLLLRSLLLDRSGQTRGALSTLEQALVLAQPGGLVAAFVDEGPPMAHLLYEAVSRGIAGGYAQQLLAAFPVVESQGAGLPTAPSSNAQLLEPLSDRELEVLMLIAQGLTNPEIATKLYLSLNTVKAHTRNIYGKLAVHSRVQAVAKGRTLGLLPLL